MLKRRAAIEPTIGHLKSGNRMDRNFLAGQEGDRINALLAAAGYNLRKLLRWIIFAPMFRLWQWLIATLIAHAAHNRTPLVPATARFAHKPKPENHRQSTRQPFFRDD